MKVNVERQSSPHREVRPPALKAATVKVASIQNSRMPKRPPRAFQARARSRRPTPRSRATTPPSPDAVAALPTNARAAPVATAESSSEPRASASPGAATAKPVPIFSARVAQEAPPGTPAPTSEPAAVALSEGHAPAPGVGIFGESREALLNTKDYLELRRLMHANQVVIVMDVSENGKALRVRSMSGVDPALRDEVSRRLMAASYVPGVCSGLPCDGQARIVFKLRGKE